MLRAIGLWSYLVIGVAVVALARITSGRCADAGGQQRPTIPMTSAKRLGGLVPETHPRTDHVAVTGEFSVGGGGLEPPTSCPKQQHYLCATPR